MKLSDRAEIRRSYSSEDIEAFTALAGARAVGTVPEPLIAGLFSYLLGVKLPGPGTNYLKQELSFLKPAPQDIELTASVEIVRIRAEKRIVDLWARCETPDGLVVCEGRSLVKVKDVGA